MVRNNIPLSCIFCYKAWHSTRGMNSSYAIGMCQIRGAELTNHKHSVSCTRRMSFKQLEKVSRSTIRKMQIVVTLRKTTVTISLMLILFFSCIKGCQNICITIKCPALLGNNQIIPTFEFIFSREKQLWYSYV